MFQTFVYTHPWIAIIWSPITDILDFLLPHLFEIIIVLLLLSIRHEIGLNSMRSESLHSLNGDIKDTLEKINYNIQEISEAISPIARDRKIEIDVRDGTLTPHEARLLRGG